MENVRSESAKKFIIIALCLALCILSLLPVFTFGSNAEDSIEGRAFTAADVENPLMVLNPYTEMPRAFAATVRFDGGVDTASPIISNLKSYTVRHRSFEITPEGKPAISSYYKFDGMQRYEYIEKKNYVEFDYSLIDKGEVHLVAVDEIVDGKSVYKLYANGELVDTVTDHPHVYNNDVYVLQRTRCYSIGCDAKSYFSGVIKNVAVYSEALTADEVASVFASNDNESEKIVSHDAMMAYYDLTSEENTDRYIKDQTGNGHYASDLFGESKYSADDYAYSIAVIGDTQSLTIKDVTDGTNYTSYIYEWIARNKKAKNIQFVMGLGDVTDENAAEEWLLVADLHNKLEAINLPYSLIQGNHDSVERLDKNFKDKANFTEAAKNGTIGYFEADSLANYYMTFTATDKTGKATDNKYLVLNLECKVPDKVIPWANQVIEEHWDHQVIINTHEYVQFPDSYFMHRYPTVEEGVANDPYQIWSKLASQHENVIMVLSGHLSIPTISMKNPSVGVNGNTVYEFLIDPQTFDKEQNYETGMVAMFYFSADGKTVKTEYVSTYKSLAALGIDPSATQETEESDTTEDTGATSVPDIISNPYMSNHTLDIGKKVALSPVECEYGTIPAAYSNAETYPFVVFKADKTFVGGYLDFGDVMKAMVEIDASANYNVLMRRNAEQYYSSDVSELRGNINIDLGGFILVKCNSGYLINISVSDNSVVEGDDVRAVFKIMNGTINKCAGEALVCVDYGTADTGLSETFTTTIDFENVKIAKYSRDKGTNLVFDTKETGYSNTTGDACAIVNSTFTNCTFDFRLANVPCEALQLSNTNGDRIVYNVKIVGSEIVSTVGLSFSDFAVVDGDANGRADSVVFAKNGDGEFFIQRLTSGAIAPGAIELWYGDDGTPYVPGESGTVDGYKIYKLGGYTESRYGNVPDGNDGYAIWVFHNGSFAGGFNEFGGTSGAIAAAKILTDGNADGERGSTVYIYFVGDAPASSVYVNLGQSCGNIVIDLDGHTLTQKYTGESLFTTQAKLGTGLYPYSLTVINGNIALTNKGILTFDAYGDGYVNAEEEYKEFTGKFENVNFSYASDSAATAFLGYYKNSDLIASKKTLYNVDFTDCTFDFTNAASMATVMNANDKNTSDSNDIIKVNVYGSEIITSNSALVLEDVHSTNGSSVHWEASSEGNYLYMTVNGSTEAPTSKVNRGASSFVKASETESSVTYTLEQIGIQTKYGVLLNEHADYVFAVFAEGVSIAGYNEFNRSSADCAMKTAKSKSAGGIEAQILMLKNYEANPNEYYSDPAQCNAKVTIDLNGYTFYANSSKAMFQLHSKKDWKTTIDVINGNVVLKSAALLEFQKYTIDGKVINMNFVGVNFSLAEESALTSMIAKNLSKSTERDETYKVTWNITFTDCVFDVTNAASKITIFKADYPTNDSKPSEINYVLEGCEIKASSMDKFTTWGDFNANSSYEYRVSSTTGLYTTITLPDGAAAPDPKEEIVIGGKSFGYAKESEATVEEITYITYALGEMTKYGPIPPKFESVTSYPFVLFDQYGNCINASNLLYDDNTATNIINIAKDHIKGNGSLYNAEDETFGDGAIQAFVLMRCDYDLQSENKYDNFSQIRGTVTIDLNGFTLNARDDKVMVRAYAKAWGIITTTEIVFKNGDIVTVGRPMLAYRGEFNTADGKKFIFRYEDINFKVEGSVANFLALYNGVNDAKVTEQIKMSSEVYFKNCVIDLTNATCANILLFDLGDEYTSTNVTLDGVKIISDNGAFTLSGKTNEASTGILKCTGSGVTLSLPIGVEAPSDNTYVFVESSRDEINVTYTMKLAKIESIDFAPKTSITLGSELVYNVYIPKADYLTSYTVDGATYENAELVTLDDGVTYYHVAVALPSYAAAKNIVSKVTLTIDDKNYAGTWNISIPKYAKAVIESSAIEKEVTLVKDVLAYIRAAYVYFDSEGKDEAVTEIDEILGAYNNAFEKVSGETNTESGLKSVIIILDTKPIVRFVLPEGKTTESYTFKSGNSTLAYTPGTYTEGEISYEYAELELYAYQLIDEITYTDGEYTGSYHINSYYDFVTTDENYKTDTNLISLVEKLYNYCKSAAAYRDTFKSE